MTVVHTIPMDDIWGIEQYGNTKDYSYWYLIVQKPGRKGILRHKKYYFGERDRIRYNVTATLPANWLIL